MPKKAFAKIATPRIPHTETQVLDFYHASSYLGAVANAKYPKDKSAHQAWLEDRCHQLKHAEGAAEALYKEMVALQARKCTQKLPQHLRDKLGAAITYYKNHRHQMNYISYTEQNFPIGSGVTEAACKGCDLNLKQPQQKEGQRDLSFAKTVSIFEQLKLVPVNLRCRQHPVVSSASRQGKISVL